MNHLNMQSNVQMPSEFIRSKEEEVWLQVPVVLGEGRVLAVEVLDVHFSAPRFWDLRGEEGGCPW